MNGVAAEPAGARLFASAWRCWRSWRLERAMCKTKRLPSKWQTKTSSISRGLRKQNLQFILHRSALRFEQRWETYVHQSSNIYSAEMQIVQCSVHKSVQCWNVKGESRTMFTKSVLGASGVVISTRCKAQNKIRKQEVKVLLYAK